MQKEFESYEIVKITKSSHPFFKEMVNKKGYIAGDIFSNKLRKRFYVVFVIDKQIAFHFSVEDLESTGEFFEERYPEGRDDCRTVLCKMKRTLPFLQINNISVSDRWTNDKEQIPIIKWNFKEC